MSERSKPPDLNQKWKNLEMANQMFKDAFLVKKTRFSKQHPELSENELDKMTADYFRNLPDDDGKRGLI